MKMRKKTRKKRKASGSKLAGAALLLLFLFTIPASADKKPKKASETGQPFAVIAGTVFRPPGFALPGAGIQIVPDSEGKPKKITAVSDGRGEFAVRVSSVPLRYTVSVQCNGYQSQRKTVQIEGEQRKELTFQLEPEAK